MTKSEFLKLDLGTVLSPRFNRNEFYMVDDIDQMGTSYKGSLYRVLGATTIDLEPSKCARIDKNNYDFWHIEGRMIKEK